MSLKFGDDSEKVTPVPIPNTEVKLLSPDGTAQATVWESRKSPGLKQTKALPTEGFCSFPHTPLPAFRCRPLSPHAILGAFE